ncbi:MULTISPECIES: TlpA family protein disulfide reductase [Natrialbaceae]|uniref:TlpA family protein disulfide reductase n=1 Tax=Natrialbaceae TaxID=1644061 RepID=UPI00207C85C0|nr:TlpA family protein disulfide reductase [Natronococcus sp. CG52]
MRRRAVLSLAGLVAIGGCLDGSSDSEDDDSEADDTEADGDESEAASPPFDVATVDAPGSEAGSMPVPQEGQVTFVNFTRLLCPTSEGLIETIGDVRSELESRYEVGSDGDVRLVSVIDPRSGPDPSDDELAEWWEEHDGRWPIGVDEDGSLNDYYDVEGFPTVVVVDGDGEVHWRDTGGTSSRNMVSGVERALEAEPEVADPDSDSE